MLTPEIV